MYNPKYTLTQKILELTVSIEKILGQYEGAYKSKPRLELRKHNRNRNIQSSLSIEGNTLTFEQVSKIAEGEKVQANKTEILEVKNAIRAYDEIFNYTVDSVESLLYAHKLMMEGLIGDAGHFRVRNIRVVSGRHTVYVAPEPKLVPQLMEQLFQFMKNERKLNPLVLSSVFHYELEFIHPFSDGNGRMGRLWQSAILTQYNKLFEFIPIESTIKSRQFAYYQAIRTATKEKESTAFVEFMLGVTLDSVKEFTQDVKPARRGTAERLKYAQEVFAQKKFKRNEYIKINQNISPSLASKDLAYGVKELKILKKEGDKINTFYKFAQKTIV